MDFGDTNANPCLASLDSACFIMDRARHVSIDGSSVEKLIKTIIATSAVSRSVPKRSVLLFCLDILCNNGWKMFNKRMNGIEYRPVERKRPTDDRLVRVCSYLLHLRFDTLNFCIIEFLD